MSSSVPDVAATRPQTVLRVAPPSLAAATPTAMLLVDYALNWRTMPSPEPVALAEGLPADLVERSWPVRASMAHGAVLRALLVHQLPADHPGHAEWTALRRWISGWSDAFVNGLIDFGRDSVMTYGQPPRDPEPTAAAIVDRSEPTEAVPRDGPAVMRAWAIPNQI